MFRITLASGEVVSSNKCEEEGSFLVCDRARYPLVSVQKVETDDRSLVGAIIGGLILMGLGLG